ncbi:MAG: hypothetical protein ACRECO_00975 [Xanthobacteraceae bacterium]
MRRKTSLTVSYPESIKPCWMDTSELSSDQVAELARIDARVVPGRACGSCTLCCKVVSIPELGKAAGSWCKHCRPGRGCGIHAARPYVCRGAYCEWMISKGLGPEWKPERSKFALFKTNDGRRLTAHVDPGYPSAWRQSPYYENFKQWAREAAQKTPEMHVVDVMIGEHAIVILPDREVELGIVPPDEMLRLNKFMTPMGEVIEVEKIKHI